MRPQQYTLASLTPHSRSLLNFLAFLAPDNIPLLLLELENPPTDFPNNKIELDASIAQCQSLSLITQNDSTLSLSPDLQKFLRESIPEPDQRPFIESAIQKLAAILPNDIIIEIQSWPLYRLLDAHILSLSQFAEEHQISPAKTANVIQLLGCFHLSQANHAIAESLFRRSLKITESALGANHPDVARDLNNLAILLNDTQRPKEAEPLFLKSIQINESAFGPNHPSITNVLNNYAQLLHDANRLEEAESLLRRSLQIYESVYGSNHSTIAHRLNNLALLLYDARRFEEAEPLYIRSIQIAEQALGPDHHFVATLLHNFALFLQTNSRIDDAELFLSSALEIFIKFHSTTGAEHPHFQPSLKSYRKLLKRALLSKSQRREKLKPFQPYIDALPGFWKTLGHWFKNKSRSKPAR